MFEVPRLAISAVRGGLGKTTMSIGIIAAWRKKGKRIAVFKKGPDFIDTGWLGLAAGRPCYNLDLFMMNGDSVLRSFIEHSAGADAAVVEGNRGLYDGVDEAGTYSTARLTQLAKTPVVLIVDCTKSSGTVGAMVLGCQKYDPGVALAGVILNNVTSGRHETVIRKAVEQNTHLPVVGAVPRLKHGEFPERHMGLTPYQEHPDVEGALAASAAMAEKYLDLSGLWGIACEAPGLDPSTSPTACDLGSGQRYPVTIGIIRDSAFQFYYPDNLEALEHLGARRVEINALTDTKLPEIDALYIGGGFPETHAAQLAANEGFCSSLKTAAQGGLPIYAECGGLIYLGRSLRVGEKTYSMAGVLPVDFELERRPQAHGYTILEVDGPNPFFDKGVVVRGHEFHYSRVLNLDTLPSQGFGMRRGYGVDGKGDGLVYKNVMAAYTHIHALGTPEWAPGLLKKALEYSGQARTTARA